MLFAVPVICRKPADHRGLLFLHNTNSFWRFLQEQEGVLIYDLSYMVKDFQQHHVIADKFWICPKKMSFRTRYMLFQTFFKTAESFVFCVCIFGQLEELRIAFELNIFSTVPVAYTAYLKETYHNLKQLLKMIN